MNDLKTIHTILYKGYTFVIEGFRYSSHSKIHFQVSLGCYGIDITDRFNLRKRVEYLINSKIDREKKELTYKQPSK